MTPRALSASIAAAINGTARMPTPPPKPDLAMPVTSTASTSAVNAQAGDTPAGKNWVREVNKRGGRCSVVRGQAQGPQIR